MVLGFDTSNYTTSVAISDGVGGKNCSRLLDVRPGELGLRQSDAMESVIAASFMDGGFAAAKEIIDRLILSNIPKGRPRNFDYKTAFQELVQRKKDQQIHYELTGESGPDHDKHFEVEVLLNGKAVGHGVGSSKKRAEQAAAEAAIEALFPGEI